MAKTKGALFSQSASGAIGKKLIIGAHAGGQLVKCWHKPTGTPSDAQMAQRAMYRSAALAWASLSPAQKTAYGKKAATTGGTGYNQYLRENLKKNPSPAGTPWDGGTTKWDGGATIWSEQ